MSGLVNGENKAQVYHQPNWHHALSPILGDLEGQLGYVTEHGTIELLGSLYDSPELPRTFFESDIQGPTQILSAESSTGLM
jgi:hypothetical protein